MDKHDVLAVLATAMALEADEVEHRTLQCCHEILSGESDNYISPARLLVAAQAATSHLEHSRLLAAYYVLDVQINEARGLLFSGRRDEPDLTQPLDNDMTDTKQPVPAKKPAWLKLVPKIDSPAADAAIREAEAAADQPEVLREPKAVGAALAAVADAMDRK